MSSAEVNEGRLSLMVKYGLTHATWDDKGVITSAGRAAGTPVPRPAEQAAAGPGPAQKLADAFAARLKREHDTRFAASHFRPKLELPKVEDDVPRAVRAKSASDGRPSKSKRNR